MLQSCYNMAASVEDLKGYDHQFVEPPPDDLLCLICLCVARDPQQINCCGKLLCKGCLEKHKECSDDCPQCRKPINTFSDKRSKFFTTTLVENYVIHNCHITQVREISFHSMLSVTIHLVAVSGLESYGHWMNTWLAVTSLSCHALMNATTGLKWSSYFVDTWRNTQRRSVQDASTSVLTARRLGSIEI